MVEQLKYLVELQMLEDKKTRLIRDCEETPRHIAEKEKEFEDFHGDYVSKKAEYDHVKKMHRSLDQNISDLEAKITRSKTRMNEVKTNKEYQALLKEIEDTKNEIAAKEDEALELMERIDSLGKHLKEAESEVDKRKARIEEEKKNLQREADLVKGRLEQLEAMERKIREKIDPILLKRCDYLFEKRAGIAVAAVEAGVCQVCHLNIPPQKFIELQRDESILQCPNCLRFLYWLGNESYHVFEEDLEGQG